MRVLRCTPIESRKIIYESKQNHDKNKLQKLLPPLFSQAILQEIYLNKTKSFIANKAGFMQKVHFSMPVELLLSLPISAVQS